MAVVELHLNHLQILNSFFLKQDRFKDFFSPINASYEYLISLQSIVMK